MGELGGFLYGFVWSYPGSYKYDGRSRKQGS